jgi:predicted CoA-binding protein
MTLTDADLTDILASTRVIACVGVSMNPVRPSHYVARYLSLKGYRVIGVNPGHAGAVLFGEPVVARLSDIPAEAAVDMIDIFRRSEHVLPVVEEALAALPGLRTVWMQIGVRNAEAAALSEARGLRVVQDRCPKIEYQRLHGELRWGGFNTGLVSSRRPPTAPGSRS